MKRILITGGAGFIGSTLAEKLLKRGDKVCAIDNLDPFYSVAQKKNNLNRLLPHENFRFVAADFTDYPQTMQVFDQFEPEVIAHLGAKANVRHSMERPEDFVEVNVTGTSNLLRLASQRECSNFVFASTGSIYGKREDVPFKETDHCDAPLAAYPATKKAAELLGHAFYNIEGLNFTSLRFFNVYGPNGRPDMMPFRVANAILDGSEIPVFGEGKLERDWTYVDDLVNGFISAIDRPLGYEIINLGRGNPVALNRFLSHMQEIIGKSANLKYVDTPASEAPRTFADISKAKELLDFAPGVDLREGLETFWEWFKTQK